MHVGLTGGIGSGKSTVAAMLVDCGAAVIDSDAIARAATAPGGAAIAPIARQFGVAFVTAEGAMDRDAMRQLVFADPQAKSRLEAIVHPLVGEETARQAAKADSACVVFDVPLLVESGRWRQRVDKVLVIDCSEETQITRVMARNGWSREAVQQIIAGQASRDERLAAADICIYNEEALSLAALKVMVRELAQRFGL
ncbi:dephospho-CoA kinase [Polaromonas sp. A23]|uniref:dephospho-CoA kinase n=1 Tax=Polaromonas sp. A23 TaxID=1944133 RepID=UPI00098527C0|nr:dephospho-CoA kinase [Polaromonas sp. A23]OOG41180.1 dephospho-CoA kinase [Polaromonas sp. A23]